MDQHLNTDPAKKDRSIGEKIFDWGTYSGINGIGTFALTLPVAYWMKYGGGKGMYDSAAKTLSEKVFHHLPGSWNEGISKGLLSTTILMQGGNLMLLPVGIAEHYKVPIVKGLNRLFNDPTDPATIEEAPKQTVGTLVMGRLRAFAMVFAAFTGAGFLVGKQMSKFESAFGRAVCAFLNKPIKEIDGITNTPAFRYGEMAALDVFATTAATILLYDGSHKFAAQAQEKKRAGNHGTATTPFADENPSAASDAPIPRVSHVERAEDRVAEAPQRLVSAG